MDNCDKFLRNISNYIDGDLQMAEQAFMEEHEVLCPPCRKKVLQISQLTKRLPLLPQAKTKPSFDLVLHSRLRTEINRKRPFTLFPNLGSIWQIPAYAAAAILFIGLGILLDRVFVQQNIASSTAITPIVVNENRASKTIQPDTAGSTLSQTRMSHYVGLKQINPKDLLRREGIASSSEGMRRLSSIGKDSIESRIYKSRESGLNVQQANASIGF